MSRLTFKTDAYTHAGETCTIETSGDLYMEAQRAGYGIVAYLVGIQGSSCHITIKTDKGGRSFDGDLPFEAKYNSIIPPYMLWNNTSDYFIGKYGESRAQTFIDEYTNFYNWHNALESGYLCYAYIPHHTVGVATYDNSIDGYGLCTPNGSGFGSPQANDYNKSGGDVANYAPNSDATARLLNRNPYQLFMILQTAHTVLDYKFSDVMQEIIDDNYKAVTLGTSVDWYVNVDGAKNPNITITFDTPWQEKPEESSVVIRAYGSAEPGHMAVVDASKYIGRYAYSAQPLTFSWNKIYKESGTGANYLDEALKFAKNLIGKMFTNSGATVELFFNMTYIMDGVATESSWCYAQIDYYGNVTDYGVVGGQFDDGSTVTITRKNLDDIYDEFEDDIDDIDTNNYGVSALSLLTQTYVLTTSRLKQFGHYLWDRSFADAILDINQAPIENVISCKVFPFEIKGGDDVSIVLGNVDSGVMGSPITENTNFIINIGNFTIPKKYNNWIDYTMTTIGIFLPMCGFFSLDANTYIGKTINVKYYIDILTGVCKAVISINNIPVQEFGGQIGFDIPLTSQNRAQVELAQITSFAGGVTSLAKGNLTGGLSGVMNGVIRPRDIFQTAGSLSPTCNMMTTHDVFIVIERPVVQYPSNYGHIYGYPCYLKNTLNSLSGFTKCENVDVVGISCTNREKDLIKDYLERGVYIQ